MRTSLRPGWSPPSGRAVAITAALFCAGSVHGQTYRFFDNGEFALLAVPGGGVLEPPIPLYLMGQRVDDPNTPGPDLFTIIDLYDRVPDTSSWPLTAADIIANGYVRPLVQRADGGASAFGTSIVTGPSFREAGKPLDIIPDMTWAEVLVGAPDGAERLCVVAGGAYGAKAAILCQRYWPNPIVGRTDVIVELEWEALTDIPLEGGAFGRGFDAFRLTMFSSMLADTTRGEYDARYLRVAEGAGPVRTIEIRDSPRPRYLFASPRPIAVGGAFALLKDNQAAWNPGSPSVEITVETVSPNVGALGVQGYLAGTRDPNDDSLSVWLEWLDAPAVIPGGTTIEARLRIVATPATDPGDLNHDGLFTRSDAVRCFQILGRVETDADFDAYADLDRDRTIGDADFQAVASLVGQHPADFTGDGVVNSLDVLTMLAAFASGDSSGDLNEDSLVDTRDVILFLNLFSYAT